MLLANILNENQAGFRRQRFCIDLQIILDQTLEKQEEIHVSYIDFEKNL